MQSSYRSQVLWVVFTVCAVSSPLHAMDQVQPILDGAAAMNIAVKLATEATHGHNYSIPDMRFDSSTREWTAKIDASLDPHSTKRFVATVNESTGLACLELPPATGCVIRENIQQIVTDTQAKTEALAMARKYPAPDLQNMADILLRYQFSGDPFHRNDTSRARYFVSIPSPDTTGLVDLSSDVAARLKQDGIETYPGSFWKEGAENGSMSMHFSIGLPVRRPDGNYDVSYGYYCGSLCAGWYTAVMKHDARGWHVVSTVMNAVS